MLKRWMKVAKDKIGQISIKNGDGMGEDEIKAQRLAHMHRIILRIIDESVDDLECNTKGVALMEAIVYEVCDIKR